MPLSTQRVPLDASFVEICKIKVINRVGPVKGNETGLDKYLDIPDIASLLTHLHSQCPADSGCTGNAGPPIFDTHDSLQFRGVNLSTIALNASCTTLVTS